MGDYYNVILRVGTHLVVDITLMCLNGINAHVQFFSNLLAAHPLHQASQH